MLTAMASPRRIRTYAHDGLTFDVTDGGPIDGEPVVLLHGFPQTSTSWDRVSALLHEEGYRTLAPDLRGYSPGARPSGRRAYAGELLAADVAALLERVGRPVHLVGHDWGSAVGWYVAASRPDLLLSWTAVSVPHPAAFMASMTRSTQLLKSWYMGFFQLPVLPELLLTRARGLRERALAHAGMDRRLRERFQVEMVEGGALPGGLGYYRGLPFSMASVGGTVRVPTMMVWSTGDVALGRKGVDLTPQHVDAPYELVVLQGVSHWIPDHEPQVLVDAITRRARAAAA
jgi:pimeloyl-ACP methyl ester carboxylesterase